MKNRFTKANWIWSIIISVISTSIFFGFLIGLRGFEVFNNDLDYLIGSIVLIFVLVWFLAAYLIRSVLKERKDDLPVLR